MVKDSRTGKMKKLVSEALSRPFFQHDPPFARLKGAKIGEPVALHDEDNKLHSWIVPLFFKDIVCGTVQVNSELEIMRVNSHCKDDEKTGGFNINFFKEPPKKLLDEVCEKYDILSQPILSFDRNPTRWGWRLTASVEGEEKKVFITPSGWYIRSIMHRDIEG